MVALAVEVTREDGEDGHNDAHDGEGVGHCRISTMTKDVGQLCDCFAHSCGQGTDNLNQAGLK